MDRIALMGEPSLPTWFPLPLDRPFTYRTALTEAGLDSRDLQWLVANGFLRRPLKGCTSPRRSATRQNCDVPAYAWWYLRMLSSSTGHAGWIHGAEMVLAPNEHINLAPIAVFLPQGRRLRNDLADSGERSCRHRDIVEVDGLRVTTPIRTAWDLGRNRWTERSLSAMDQMLRLAAFSRSELIAGVPRFRGMRWVTVLRAMAPYADGRAESPPETCAPAPMDRGKPAGADSSVEVWAGGDFLARLDLANEEMRMAAEYDGAEWHTSPEQQAHDRQRRGLCEERAGWLIQPFVKENLYGRRQNAETLLRRTAAEARRRHRSS